MGAAGSDVPALPVPAIMDLTLVTRFYERLGAHAVNVSRRVIYLAGPRRD